MVELKRTRVVARLGVLLGTLVVAFGAWADDADLIAALQSGEHIALMRHAIAPGTGDPPNLQIGDCSTQRNLSDGGRAQAAEIGAHLRANGLAQARLVSSQWCRCQDTARLLSLGDVEELPFLNSLVSYPAERAEMTQSLRSWIGEQDLSGPTLLVSHAINIRALIGVFLAEGEIVVVERTSAGELNVVGSIPPR